MPTGVRGPWPGEVSGAGSRTSGKGFEELYLRAQEAGVRFVKALPGRVEEDGQGGVVVHYDDLARGRQTLAVDLVVLAMGSRRLDELSDRLAGLVPEVYVIGDAREPRKVLDAMAEGAEVGRTI